MSSIKNISHDLENESAAQVEPFEAVPREPSPSNLGSGGDGLTAPRPANHRNPEMVFHKGFIITDYELEVLARMHFEDMYQPDLYAAMFEDGISGSDCGRSAYASARLREIEAILGKDKVDAALADARAKMKADFEMYRLRGEKQRICEYCRQPKLPVEDDIGPCARCLRGEPLDLED